MKTKDIFEVISSEPRRHVLSILLSGPHASSSIVEKLGLSHSATSQHLALLKSKELVTEKREGRQRIYELRATALEEVSEWVMQFEQFWDNKLDNLAQKVDSDRLN